MGPKVRFNMVACLLLKQGRPHTFYGVLGLLPVSCLFEVGLDLQIHFVPPISCFKYFGYVSEKSRIS